MASASQDTIKTTNPKPKAISICPGRQFLLVSCRVNRFHVWRHGNAQRVRHVFVTMRSPFCRRPLDQPRTCPAVLAVGSLEAITRGTGMLGSHTQGHRLAHPETVKVSRCISSPVIPTMALPPRLGLSACALARVPGGDVSDPAGIRTLVPASVVENIA